MKVFLTNFSGFTRLRCFTKCTLAVIKSIAKSSYIASYVLFRTRGTGKFINNKICVAIHNSFTNIVLIPISVFKLTCLFKILTNLATLTVTSGTFRFSGVSVSNFCPYFFALVSLLHFLHDFWRKIFFLLYSINWLRFISLLFLLYGILGNMCVVIVC